MNWYFEVIKKYTVFSGRASRKEYWMFFLINFIISSVIKFVEVKIGVSTISLYADASLGAVHTLYVCWIFIPSIAVLVRRLHDTNHGSNSIFLILIPIIGWIWVFTYLVQDSAPNDNEYGPNPKV